MKSTYQVLAEKFFGEAEAQQAHQKLATGIAEIGDCTIYLGSYECHISYPMIRSSWKYRAYRTWSIHTDARQNLASPLKTPNARWFVLAASQMRNLGQGGCVNLRDYLTE